MNRTSEARRGIHATWNKPFWAYLMSHQKSPFQVIKKMFLILGIWEWIWRREAHQHCNIFGEMTKNLPLNIWNIIGSWKGPVVVLVVQNVASSRWRLNNVLHCAQCQLFPLKCPPPPGRKLWFCTIIRGAAYLEGDRWFYRAFLPKNISAIGVIWKPCISSFIGGIVAIPSLGSDCVAAQTVD